MGRHVSSAEPSKLLRYSARACQMDEELLSESQCLAGALQRFEASCREPAYRISTAYLAEQLRNRSRQDSDTDVGVRRVGEKFRLADQWRASLGPGFPGGWSPGADNVAAIARRARELRGFYDTIKKIVFGYAIVSQIRLASNGVVILRGSLKAKKAIGLAGRITRVLPKNLPRHMLKAGAGVAIMDILVKTGFNYFEYGWTSTFASATMVDAGGTLLSVSLGILGTLLCPGLGTAAGLGLGIALGIVAEWAFDKYVRERAIDWVDSSITQPVGRFLERTASRVRSVASSTVRSVSQAVKSAGAATGSMARMVSQKAIERAKSVRDVVQGQVRAVGDAVQKVGETVQSAQKALSERLSQAVGVVRGITRPTVRSISGVGWGVATTA